MGFAQWRTANFATELLSKIGQIKWKRCRYYVDNPQLFYKVIQQPTASSQLSVSYHFPLAYASNRDVGTSEEERGPAKFLSRFKWTSTTWGIFLYIFELLSSWRTAWDYKIYQLCKRKDFVKLKFGQKVEGPCPPPPPGANGSYAYGI